MNTMIRVANVTKKYDGEQVILPLTLSVYEGEFLTLLGPSGCGKTTLLRMIAGFEQPDAGEIFLAEQPVIDIPPYRRNVNMIFQNYALFPHMNVEQNILFGLQMKKLPLKEQKERLREVMAYTQLENFGKRMPTQLSGGQQQRVAIARAIINRPKVLLLDEPLGALDYQLRKSLQLDLKRLQRQLQITFIYVTHDQEEALIMSDRIAIMNKGKIEQIDTPKEVYHHPESLFAAKFIGENNIFRQNDRIFCVRPENIRVDVQEEFVSDQSDQTKAKQGRILDIVFTGNYNKIYISAEGETTPVLVYDYGNRSSWAHEQQVIVSWSEKAEVDLIEK